MEAGKTCPGQWTHGLREVRYRDFVSRLKGKRVRVRNWGREAAHWVRPVGATRERGWAGWRKVMGRGRQFWPEKLIGFIIIFFYFCSILYFFSIFVFPS
jgi:hypothetical protein